MHRNRYIADLRNLLLIVGLVTGCTNLEDARPDNLIPEDKMVAILTEIHLTEAQVSRMSLAAIDSSNIVYKYLETKLFKKMQVDTAAYRKSYNYYSTHPKEMEAIYKQITKNLERRIDTKKTPQKTEKK
ncbi:hypothetical protein GCM10028807_04920 [Spirosoma daeguense]